MPKFQSSIKHPAINLYLCEADVDTGGVKYALAYDYKKRVAIYEVSFDDDNKVVKAVNISKRAYLTKRRYFYVLRGVVFCALQDLNIESCGDIDQEMQMINATLQKQSMQVGHESAREDSAAGEDMAAPTPAPAPADLVAATSSTQISAKVATAGVRNLGGHGDP